VAAAALSSAAVRERDNEQLPSETALARQTSTMAEQAPQVRAVTTSNVYALPTRASQPVAILPGARTADALARSEDGGWVLVECTGGSERRGWIPVEVVVVEGGGLDALPVEPGAIAAAPRAPAAEGASQEQGLPDLVVANAFVLADGRLAAGIRNAGSGAVTDAVLRMRVTSAAGEILGVLVVGPTTLQPGGSATVVTPVMVERTASYRLALDAQDEIAESQESNNALTAILVPKS
jgi:hypothetical protein